MPRTVSLRDRPTYFRKVIRISAWDSPNVIHALAQKERGETPTDTIVIPGVLTWAELQARLAMWDEERRTVGLEGLFYEGKDTMLYPAPWLIASTALHRSLRDRHRQARAIGIDPAEGGDKTCWAVVDEWGLLELVSKLTPNTAIITNETLVMMRKWGVAADRVLFDRGGGGKEHADRIRSLGFNVRSMGFGEKVKKELKRPGQITLFEERKEVAEDMYVYLNRRAQMYHELSLRLDPSFFTSTHQGFAIPDGPDSAYVELRHQMSLIPRQLGDWSMYDPEGRIRMLPKNTKTPDSEEMTLVKIIGHSPDELDSVVLAHYAMTHKAPQMRAGV